MITERPAAPLPLVIDFAGRHWPTLCVSGAHWRADGQLRQRSVTQWIDEAERGPSVFSAGSLMSIAVDCSSKGRAICQRCHKKGGSKLGAEPGFQTHTHTHTHTQWHTYSRLSHFAVAAETHWALIGRWSVIKNVCSESDGQRGEPCVTRRGARSP